MVASWRNGQRSGPGAKLKRAKNPGESNVTLHEFLQETVEQVEARSRNPVTAGALGVYPWLPPVVVGDTFLAVVTDELGVPYVVRARIVPVG